MKLKYKELNECTKNTNYVTKCDLTCKKGSYVLLENGAFVTLQNLSKYDNNDIIILPQLLVYCKGYRYDSSPEHTHVTNSMVAQYYTLKHNFIHVY